MHSFRRISLIALLLPAVALAACGSSSSSDTLNKSEIAAKANKICADFNTKAKSIKTPTDINDPVQAAAYFQSAHDLAQKQVDELKALKPADDVKAQWDTYIAANNEGTAYLQKVADAAKAKDAAGGQTLLAGLQGLTDKINGAADAFGATTCGSKSGG